MKYKVGDRVIAFDNVGRNKPEDRHIGVIESLPIGLTFPYKVRYVDSGETLWSEVIGYAKQPVIVITSDGVTTTATQRIGKEIIAKATAKCNPLDQFSYDEGARIAFERLQGRDPFASTNVEPEQKYYNGKVVCIKTGYPWWTVGKVYNVVDGVITADDGDKYPKYGDPYVDAEDIRYAGCSGSEDGRHNQRNEFVKLVEE